MPEATRTHTTPRRTLFGAAALMALAIPARAADHNPDADLIAACAAFDVLERRYQATDFTHDDDTPEGEAADAERDAIALQQRDLLNTICTCRFTTIEGASALVRTLALYTNNFDGELWDDEPDGYRDERLRHALMRGLIATGGAA